MTALSSLHFIHLSYIYSLDTFPSWPSIPPSWTRSLWRKSKDGAPILGLWAVGMNRKIGAIRWGFGTRERGISELIGFIVDGGFFLVGIKIKYS